MEITAAGGLSSLLFSSAAVETAGAATTVDAAADVAVAATKL